MKRIFSPVDSEIEAQNSGSGRDAAPSQIRIVCKDIIIGQDDMQMQQAKKARMRSGGSPDSSTCSLGSKKKKKMSVISFGDETGTGTEVEVEVEGEAEAKAEAKAEAQKQEQTDMGRSPALHQVPAEIVRKSTRPRRKPQEHLVSSTTQHHAYAPPAPTGNRKHRYGGPGAIIPLDADDLSSDEEQEFQQFVAKTFQLRESAEEADHYSSSGGAGSGSRIQTLKAQGISVYPSVHAPCPMAELPFWNLQHRKHIHVRLDESCAMSDITLMTGRMSASRNTKRFCSLSDPEKQTSWYEHYPFRFAQSVDHGSGDTDATGHGNDHHGEGNGAGAASKRRSSKAHPMYGGEETDACKVAGTFKPGASRDKSAVAVVSKDHAKHHHHHHKSSRTNRHEARRHRYDDIDVLHQQFVPHKTKKGWVVCNICNEEQWAPNMRKHQRTCPEHHDE